MKKLLSLNSILGNWSTEKSLVQDQIGSIYSRVQPKLSGLEHVCLITVDKSKNREKEGKKEEARKKERRGGREEKEKNKRK